MDKKTSMTSHNRKTKKHNALGRMVQKKGTEARRDVACNVSTLTPYDSKNIYSTNLSSADFTQLETLVEQGLKAFYVAGCALRRIKEEKFYLTTHNTFQAYCKDRFNLERAQRGRLIRAAKAIDNLKSAIPEKAPNGSLLSIFPSSERQARPLTSKGMTPEMQVVAWRMAVNNADGKPVTAKIVQEAVRQVKGETRKEIAARLREPPKELDDAPPPFLGAARALRKQVAKQIENDFADVPLKLILETLDALRGYALGKYEIE